MDEPTPTSEPTVQDVLEGLEAVENWLRQMRDALASLPRNQVLATRPDQVVEAPALSRGKACS